MPLTGTSVLRFGSQQLHKYENEGLRLRQVFFEGPAHLFAEDGDELYVLLDYAV
jgi:hypothetical protein